MPNFDLPPNLQPEEDNNQEKDPPIESVEYAELAEMYHILPIRETLDLQPGMGLKEFFMLKAKALGLTFEEYQQYMQWEHEQRKLPVKELREVKPEEITDLETLIEQFEASHSLAELNEIVNLSPELSSLFKHSYDLSKEKHFKEIETVLSQLSVKEAENYKKRLAAKEDLIPIHKVFNEIERETNISPEKYDELKAKYMMLSNAVGIINNNKVEHNR